MAIIAVRIDGRLLHGQVANLWTTSLGASRIMVIDNKIAVSDVDKAGLKLAKPAGVNLSILSEQKAANNIISGRYDSQKVFIVIKRPQVVLDLVQMGVPVKVVNVGNMSQTEETQPLTKSINVIQSDVDAFRKLSELGVNLTAQMVPNDPINDFMPLLSKFKP